MHRQQVVVIHGGDSFLSYQQYLRYLRTYRVTRNSFLPRHGWKDNLPRTLGRGYQVFLPQMPNKFNAKYAEWKLWFSKMLPYVYHGVILVGHSLGGIFLAKYLSQRKFPKKIKAVLLVAPPHNSTPDIGNFTLLKSLSRMSQQCRNIHFFFSKNDPIVRISEMKRYKKNLPAAQFHKFTNRGHFNQERFPELVRLINSL